MTALVRRPLDLLAALLAPACAFAAMGICWGGLATLIPLVKARIGASDGLFGLLLALGALGLVVGLSLAPRLVARLGPLALSVATAALGLAILLPGLATTPTGFLAAIFVLAIASGLTDVVMNARVSEVEARLDRPLMNFAHGLYSLFYAVGAVLGGLAREGGWPPLAILAPAAAAALLLAPLARGGAGEEAPAAGPGAARLPLGPLLLCGAIVLLAFQTEGAIEQWSALFIERSLGGSAAEGALGPATLGITMALGRFGGQAVAARLGPGRLIRGAATLATLGALSATLAETPAQAYAGFALLGLGISVLGPTAIAEAGRLSPPGARTRAIARTAVVGFAGFFIGPPIMGLIAEVASLRAAVGALGAFTLLAGALSLLLPRRPS